MSGRDTARPLAEGPAVGDQSSQGERASECSECGEACWLTAESETGPWTQGSRMGIRSLH